LSGCNRFEGVGNRDVERVDGPCGGLAQQRFEFGVCVFDRIEVGRIGRQQDQACTAGLDRGADGGAFVRRQIVHHDDVAGIESRRQHLFDIGAECGSVHRAVERHRRGQGGVAQGGSEGRGQPMAVRDRGAAALTAFRAAVKPRHFGRGAGLVDENQLFGIKLRREFAPGLARRRNIGPILFGCVRAFF